MKIPKYIEQALQRRVRAAEILNSADYIISQFIENNAIEVEEYDYLSGVEMYVNPWASADRIRKAILAKEKPKKGR